MNRVIVIGSFLFFLFTVLFTSCEKEHDKFIGEWQSIEVGTVTTYYNGSVMGIEPINEKGKTKVKKSKKKDLSIDGVHFIYDKGKLTAEPKEFEISKNGVTLIGTETCSGQMSNDEIIINKTIEGTWNNNGVLGRYSSKKVLTLEKKDTEIDSFISLLPPQIDSFGSFLKAWLIITIGVILFGLICSVIGGAVGLDRLGVLIAPIVCFILVLVKTDYGFWMTSLLFIAPIIVIGLFSGLLNFISFFKRD